jgi:ubiquitin-like protein Pup
MAEQERKPKRQAGSEPEPLGDMIPAASGKVAERSAKIKKDIDDVIDEIDNILEDNAEEFVKSYLQRGGE